MNNQINLVLSSTQLYIIIGIAAFLVLLLIINLVLCFVLRSTRRKWQLEKERSSLITRLNMVEEELSIPYKERHVLVTYGTLERISKGDISAVLAEEQEVIEEQKTENITEDEDLADEECLSQELTEDLDEEMTENQVEDNCEETLDDENQVALQEQTQETLEDENVTKEDLSQEDLNEYMTESREDGDEENEESTQTVDGENQNAFERGIELAVKDMTDVERLQLDLTDEQYDDKTYLVQYTKGFMAKLRLADDMTKEEYRLLMQEISSFKGMKADLSFNQQRVHKGREAVAILFFKGKKLCVALALNPADYEETKYHGKDVGNTKRFEKTPMMMKITSERRGKYARYLLGEVANALGLERVEPQEVDIDLNELTKDEMLLSGEMRIKILNEVSNTEQTTETLQEEQVPENLEDDTLTEENLKGENLEEENITEEENLAEENVAEETLSQGLTEDLAEESLEEGDDENDENQTQTVDEIYMFGDENAEQTEETLQEEQVPETLEDETLTEETLEEGESDEEDDDDNDDEGDEANDENEEVVTQSVDGENQKFGRGVELAVKDMTDVERLILDFVDEQYEDKTYLVQYTKGFMAKLRLADDMTKEEYRLLMQEISSFKGMKADLSFNQQRVHKGREAVAILLFKGKKLCVAFALNPADYEETKYHGKDVGNTKRFEKTPMMMKITSERKGKYARHLLGEVANALGLERVEPQNVDIDLKELTKDDMLLSGEMRIKSLGEVQKDNENL